MKKVIGIVLALCLVFLAIALYSFFASTTRFSGKEKVIYIKTNQATREAVMETLVKDSLVKSPKIFSWFAGKLNYWDRIKPGRYKITKGMSVSQIARLLRRGTQFPARLVINKIRLTADLAGIIGRVLEADSVGVMAVFNNPDSLKTYGVNDTTLLAHIVPDTYEVLWTWTPERVLKKLFEGRDAWWGKNNREEKARKLGLKPEEVHTLASIVEEESNVEADKPKIASVYLNRLRLGMPLQADPTIRFALKNFTMNRILYAHLRTQSPYNTYINRGLPPGPICTPAKATIDAVLDAPKTDYLFFVANADLRGGSTFTTNLADHNKAAKIYQDSLTAWLKRKATQGRQ